MYYYIATMLNTCTDIQKMFYPRAGVDQDSTYVFGSFTLVDIHYIFKLYTQNILT